MRGWLPVFAGAPLPAHGHSDELSYVEHRSRDGRRHPGYRCCGTTDVSAETRSSAAGVHRVPAANRPAPSLAQSEGVWLSLARVSRLVTLRRPPSPGCSTVPAPPLRSSERPRHQRDQYRVELPRVEHGTKPSAHAPAAPRGALLYPRPSREELEGRFLGLMADLDPKGEGDNSMPGK